MCFLICGHVDDTEIFLKLLVSIAPSVQCHTTVNYQGAFEELPSEAVKPNLIFLGLNIPLMNDNQFLKVVCKHEILAAISVVRFSTSSEKGIIERAKQPGTEGSIMEPDRSYGWKKNLSKTLKGIGRAKIQKEGLSGNLVWTTSQISQKETAPQIRITGHLAAGPELDESRVLKTKNTCFKSSTADYGMGFNRVNAATTHDGFGGLDAKNEYQGTKISVVMHKKRVQNHGKDIYAESTLGNGATFHVFLPQYHNHLT